jgi:hypothetical protein
MRNKKWVRLLAYVTGSGSQELLLQNEYLGAENRILRAKLPSRLRLSNPERATLAEIGKRLGRKALREVACVAKPDTILAWYRRPKPHYQRLASVLENRACRSRDLVSAAAALEHSVTNHNRLLPLTAWSSKSVGPSQADKVGPAVFFF